MKVRPLKQLWHVYGEALNLDWQTVAARLHRAGLIDLLPDRNDPGVFTHYRPTAALKQLHRAGIAPKCLSDRAERGPIEELEMEGMAITYLPRVEKVDFPGTEVPYESVPRAQSVELLSLELWSAPLDSWVTVHLESLEPEVLEDLREKCLLDARKKGGWDE